MPEKLASFGWEAVEINGHDHEAIFNAVMNRRGERPLLVVCRTVKGKGVSYMSDVPIWHYRSPNRRNTSRPSTGSVGDFAVRNRFA